MVWGALPNNASPLLKVFGDLGDSSVPPYSPRPLVVSLLISFIYLGSKKLQMI